MKKQIIWSLIFCATFSVAHAARINFNKLFNSGISYTGRTISDTKGNVSYDWIGTYLQTDFTGGSIAVDIAEADTSYHNVFIDGQLLKKIKVYGKQLIQWFLQRIFQRACIVYVCRNALRGNMA